WSSRREGRVVARLVDDGQGVLGAEGHERVLVERSGEGCVRGVIEDTCGHVEQLADGDLVTIGNAAYVCVEMVVEHEQLPVNQPQYLGGRECLGDAGDA